MADPFSPSTDNPAAGPRVDAPPTVAAATDLERRWRDLEAFAETRPAVLETRLSRLRQRKIHVILALMLALAGVCAGLLTWLRPVPPPFFVPLWITEYESRLLPVEEQAVPDRTALCTGGYFSRIDENAFASQEGNLLKQDLDALGTRTNAAAVAIYLCAFAGTGEKGDVVLFPADVKPDNYNTRLSLRDVLETVKKSPAQNKLLILDTMRPLADPRLGVLSNDVARHIQQDLAAVPDPQRLVLCSCSPGQVSLSSEELNRSIFGYYLEEGLRGWADGYNETGERDHRVSVRELAEFVSVRVDRWAHRNRYTRQTPVLLGSGPNFPLIALGRGRLMPPVPMPEPAPYPAWLLAGWKLRDQWSQDERARIDPRLMSRLEENLLRAEAEWRGGVDPGRIQKDLGNRITQLSSQLDQINQLLPQPQPRSLALAEAQGQKFDPAVPAALNSLLTTLAQQASDLKPEERPKAEEKLIQGFLDKFKNNPPIDLAKAVFDAAANDNNPTASRIRFLDHLLLHAQPQPRYVETLFLRRLAVMSGKMADENWPSPLVARALSVVRRGERAVVRPEVFPWVRGLLDEASRLRHDGEVLLFARGYAPLAAADQFLQQASDAYDAILDHEESFRRVYDLRDRALSFLPNYLPYLDQNNANERAFLETARALRELDRELAPLPAGARLSAGALRHKGELIRQRSEAVRTGLDGMRWPFEPERVAALIDQCQQPEATPALCLSIQAILTTPFLKAQERVALWQAGRALARRTVEKTAALDAEENARRRPTQRLSAFDIDRPRCEQQQTERALLRARTSIALLELGGLPQTEIQRLQDCLKAAARADASPQNKAPAGRSQPSPAQKATPGTRNPLFACGDALRQAWALHAPALFQQETSLTNQDLLSRLMPPFELLSVVDEPSTNPTVRLRGRALRVLWAWLVDLYRFEGQDLDGSAFYVEAALEYQRQTPRLPENLLKISGCSELPSLSVYNPSAGCTLHLNLFADSTSAAAVAVGVVTADSDWLQVTTDASGLAALRNAGSSNRACAVPVQVALKPNALLSRQPRPRGFLVRVQVDGRTYYHKVTIPALPPALTERLDLLLSANPKEPAAPIGGLKLRPIKVRQPYYLFVRNTTPRPRNVLVQLKMNDAVLKGGEAKLTVNANDVQRVNFGPPLAAPAPGDLPEFAGPLRIDLFDADKPTDALDEKRVPVSIASPREYVRVTEIQFAPPSPRNGGKNRLTVKLKALAPLVGPPCYVELVLPPERIPGFVAARDGNFRGVLPADGSELLLYASNIQLAEGTPIDGIVTLTVDGVERGFIFRTTFARQGEPTTPREDDRPAVRLRADRFALSSPSYLVGVEVDNPPPGANLALSLGQAVDGAFEADLVKRLPHARVHHIGFSPQSSDGALLFEASIRDARVPIDTTGIRGQRKLEVQLFNADGTEIDEASRTVTFDDSPPDQVRFLDLPAQAQRNLPLSLSANGFDPESGIAKVFFFLGRPVDGKAPLTSPAVAASPTNDAKTTWTATLPLLGDRKGPTDVSVQFVNGVGLGTFETATIDLVDADPKNGPGKIQGVVLEGDRPQANLEVVLSGDKAAVMNKDKDKGKTKTKEDGTFVFDNVAPGTYEVSCAKPSTERKATVPVTVPPNQTVTVKVPLYK